MMVACTAVAEKAKISREVQRFSISRGRHMLWMPTCMGHAPRAVLRDQFFCRPHPSVLDRNTRSAINFCKETNGSRRFSDRKPMKRALPSTFSITKPRVACTLGWSLVYARLVAGHAFPLQKTKVRVAFLYENQCAEPCCNEFLLKTRWVHARAWARRVRRRQSELL